MESQLLISFPDQSANFVNGVEFGRIWGKMESGMLVIDNAGLPIHTDNIGVIKQACTTYGYLPTLRPVTGMDEWTYFSASKILSLAN